MTSSHDYVIPISRFPRERFNSSVFSSVLVGVGLRLLSEALVETYRTVLYTAWTHKHRMDNLGVETCITTSMYTTIAKESRRIPNCEQLCCEAGIFPICHNSSLKHNYIFISQEVEIEIEGKRIGRVYNPVSVALSILARPRSRRPLRNVGIL
jgi:hypothetical protein